MIKPVDHGEFIARLGVARRTIDLQDQLREQIADQEALLKRHNLLNKVVSRLEKNVKDKTSATDDVLNLSDFSAATAELNEISKPEVIAQSTLDKFGLHFNIVDTIEAEKFVQKWEFTSWSPLVMHENELWLDFKMETNRGTASEIYYAMLGHPAADDDELTDGLSQLLNSIIHNCATAFAAHDIATMTPFLPVTVTSNKLPAGKIPALRGRRFLFTGLGLAFHLTIIEHRAHLMRKHILRLHPQDILMESVHQPNDDEVLLLSEGKVLDEKYIRKLRDFLRHLEKEFKVVVIEPSFLTKMFHRI
jgi:hypothetical protein